MTEILPSPLISAAGVVSRPVNTGSGNETISGPQAVQPTPKASDQLRNQNRQTSDDRLNGSLENLGEKLAELLGDDPVDLRLQIDVDEEAGRFVYRSVDRETGEIVRQFPSDELLEIIRSVRETAGLALDVDA